MYYPRSRSRLPGLQLCAVWSPGQARQAPPPGKSPVALALTGATALRGLVARTRRVKRRLRENPRSRSRLPGLRLCAVWSPGQARQAPPPGNPRSRSRLPGLQLCAVWSPGQARQAPPPGKSPVALTLTGATVLHGLVARTGASSAASGEIPGRAHAYRGYGSARSGSPDRRVKRRLRENAG